MWMRPVIILLLFFLPAVAEAQRQCKKGIPCGGSCIAAGKVCHVGQKPAVDSTRRDSQPQAISRVLTPLPLVSGPMSSDSSWVASVDGTVYYWAQCMTANKLMTDERVYFRTQEAAQAQGYKRSRARGC